MRRPALYSSSRSSSQDRPDRGSPDASEVQPSPEPAQPSRFSRLTRQLSLHNVYLLWSVVGLLALLLLPPGGAGAQTLAQHCGQWSIVPSPSPGSMDILEGIAAISPQDVWTVGDYIGTQGFNQVLIERWNG